LQTITSISSTALAGTAPNSGILKSQLNRYEIQLADWCHCPSGKTPEGQQKIANLQAKADAIKAQLSVADAARSQQTVAAAAPTSESQPGRADAPTGRFLDVFA
jgi:hypothetical protein